ncbi:MAG: hypothetical protein ACJ765_10970 [Chloroflexota bacterium]
MAKRSRVAGRPGQRRPLQRQPARATAARPANAVTDEEMARAAELEAQILAEEQAADEARRGRDRRAKAPTGEATIYSSAPLAERAAQEYGYVQRDLRRIAIVGGGLLVVMAIIDILLNVLHVF